ncbi:type III pantothenate kinase [Marinobacter sp. SS5-14b]|uniref:type III pantothenate kinase n=1 Tax=Marinobacter sp. SS5-14b TaxID=3050456 RepID=UPI0026DF5A20|nr:type III pantothenate kinase [Marinobacter sp. SS5-14b]
MILLIDAGNTRVKWRLAHGSVIQAEGVSVLDSPQPFSGLPVLEREIHSVGVSSVGSEAGQRGLERAIRQITPAPVSFYGSEAQRDGLLNSYRDVSKMGSDRWYAMLACWQSVRAGFALVDAGSAVTVDYVGEDGCHLGGFILPGLQMMRRSLKLDAARIGFEFDDQLDTRPGRSTGECANHGLAWLTQGIIRQIHSDVAGSRLGRIFLTGGDAHRFHKLGLKADIREGLVLDGVQAVHSLACTQ